MMIYLYYVSYIIFRSPNVYKIESVTGPRPRFFFSWQYIKVIPNTAVFGPTNFIETTTTTTTARMKTEEDF